MEQAGFFREEILRRLQPLGVTALKFKPGPLKTKIRAKKHPGKTADRPVLLTGEEMREVDIALHPVKDEQLKELCRRVMTRAIARERRICERRP